MRYYAIIVLFLCTSTTLTPSHTYEHRLIPTITLPEIIVKPVDTEELELLARLIFSEDGHQGFESNAIVAQTVIYKTQKYNTDIYGAIFKTYSKGKAYYGAYTHNMHKKPTQTNYEAARAVLKGYRPAPHGVAYFIGKNDNPNTKWYKYISQYTWEQVGYHVYCFDPKSLKK